MARQEACASRLYSILRKTSAKFWWRQPSLSRVTPQIKLRHDPAGVVEGATFYNDQSGQALSMAKHPRTAVRTEVPLHLPPIVACGLEGLEVSPNLYGCFRYETNHGERAPGLLLAMPTMA